MAAKKKRAAPRVRENLSEQIVIRVKPSMRTKLETLAERHALRGIGEAARLVLEQGWP